MSRTHTRSIKTLDRYKSNHWLLDTSPCMIARSVCSNSMMLSVITQVSVEWLFFFFQAEDGIRDYKVTGVQTCALPIFAVEAGRRDDGSAGRGGVDERLERRCAAGRRRWRGARRRWRRTGRGGRGAGGGSGEGRGGEEGRFWGGPVPLKKKQNESDR